MDTDALLAPIHQPSPENQVEALKNVVRANTAAFKEIEQDLMKCDNQEKTTAILRKVEQAIADLSIDSQKIPGWVKKPQPRDNDPNNPINVYGQYPINQPINPQNPVPWPPGYTPPSL